MSGKTKEKPKSKLVYIYCTIDNNALLHKNIAGIWWVEDKKFRAKNKKLGIAPQPSYNGKVVGYFTLNKVSRTYEFYEQELLDKACLSDNELFAYLKHDEGYAWHIDNLVIFDKPKEISEFYGCDLSWNCKTHDCKDCVCKRQLTRAPQSWQFIEV